MQVNSISFKGTCTVGKNARHKAIIVDNLASSSETAREAMRKAKILEQVADIISSQTPKHKKLYIDIPPITKTKGFFEVLPYHHPMMVYEKNKHGKDKCVASYCINSLSQFSSPNYIILSSKNIIEDVKSHYNNL